MHSPLQARVVCILREESLCVFAPGLAEPEAGRHGCLVVVEALARCTLGLIKHYWWSGMVQRKEKEKETQE